MCPLMYESIEFSAVGTLYESVGRKSKNLINVLHIDLGSTTECIL